MNKNSYKQRDVTDCGAACLASICTYYGLKLPLSKIRRYANTDKKGTNILGLTEAASKLGFDAKGVRGTLDSLRKIPLPAIAHILVNERLHHYIVIYKVTSKFIRIMDPAFGQIKKLSIHEFEKIWTGVLVILYPNTCFQPGDQRVSKLRRFAFLLRPHRYAMVQAFVGAVIYTILGFSTAVFIQKITDQVMVNADLQLLNLLGFVMIILLLFQWLLRFGKDLLLIRSGQEIDARLILGYYNHLLQLPKHFFDSMRIGELLSRINDAVKIRLFLSSISIHLVVNSLILFFSFILMLLLNWKLGLLMIGLLPVYLLIYFLTDRANKRTERRIMEQSAELESQLIESLTNITTVKQFNVQKFTSLQTEQRFIALLQTGYKSSFNQVLSQSSVWIFSQLFTILVLWLGSHYVIDHQLSLGQLLSFYAIIGYFIGPASELISSNKTIQNALIAADRLFEILDLDPDINPAKNALKTIESEDIHFEGVTFRYGSRLPVINDLNLHFKKGQITALAGSSGSGKTTIIQLIQNLYPIEKGKISIGGADLKYINWSKLKQLISVIPQHVALFDGSVINNIALGEIDVDMQRVMKVCKELKLLTFIENLPSGFHTYLGENGASLSGGQKQRLAIARALYRNSQIFLLDEASSSLDSNSEDALFYVLNQLKSQGKTIIMVSHRRSSLKLADTVMLIEQGRLIEQGTHNELIAMGSAYARLLNNTQ